MLTKIGVAIPAYNVKKYVENCLVSINAQTVKPSIYVVDDASDDGTYEFLLDRPQLYTTLERSDKRRGWPTTLNAAVNSAFSDGCDAVFTMNADDFMRLDCIEKCAKEIEQKYFVVVYAQQIGGENVVQISKEGATLEDFKEYPPLVNYALIHKYVWNTVGGYPTDISLPDSYGYKEDWAFWIKVFKARFDRYGVVKEPVYYYVMHEGQLHAPGVLRHEEAKKLIMDKYGW